MYGITEDITMIYALIDLGSNTIRLTVYQCDKSENNEKQPVDIFFHKKTVAGLASYVEDGILSEKGMEKACFVLNNYKKVLHPFGINRVQVFATASLRNIKNRVEAVAYIYDKTGYLVDVISGEEEATYGFLGMTRAMTAKDGILLDIGGGSTEIVVYQDTRILQACSMPIGSLNLFSQCVSGLMPTIAEKNVIVARVMEEADKLGLSIPLQNPVICGVGGTIRAACRLNNEVFRMPSDNNVIVVRNLRYMTKQINGERNPFVTTILKTAPERIHTISPGMLILRTLAKRFNSKEILVSSYGVREGYLFGKIMKYTGKGR